MMPDSPSANHKDESSINNNDTKGGGGHSGNNLIKSSSVTNDDSMRPKNRKELRAERKALKKQAASASNVNRQLTREEKKALRKKEKKIEQKEQRLQLIKDKRQEKQLRKQKRRRIEQNAPGGQQKQKQRKEKLLTQEETAASLISNTELSETKIKDQEIAMNVFKSLFHGSQDEEGFTTLHKGVKYKDTVIGKKGTIAVEDGRLVTVGYKLRGGHDRKLIDSSKKFCFRVGKGEVIQGWDIGILGMQIGGTRHLIVPPKIGYGSQDIGAGSSATLYFDITLINIR